MSCRPAKAGTAPVGEDGRPPRFSVPRVTLGSRTPLPPIDMPERALMNQSMPYRSSSVSVTSAMRTSISTWRGMTSSFLIADSILS